jgi:hypothetical protein
MAESSTRVHRQRLAKVVPPALLIAVATSLVTSLVLRAILTKPPINPFLYGAFGAVWSVVVALTRSRRRTLTVTDEGLEAQRDKFRVVVRWADFEDVTYRRAGGLKSELLTFRTGEIVPISSKGQPTTVNEEAIRRVGADRNIQIGTYFANWMTSPVGESLKAAEPVIHLSPPTSLPLPLSLPR